MTGFSAVFQRCLVISGSLQRGCQLSPAGGAIYPYENQRVIDETSAVIHANLAMRLEGAGLHAEAEAAAERAGELGLDDSTAGLLVEL